MTDSVFNSRSLRHKTPFGAVPSGVALCLTACPESSRLPLRGFLCLEYERLSEQIEIPMDFLGARDGRDIYTARVETEGYVGLIFYHFRFENEGGFFRYGARPGKSGGECEFYGNASARPFQITVYAQSGTPKWFGEGITYQIFPDRFARSGEPDTGHLHRRGKWLHQNWADTPAPAPSPDFFGGNLRGITEKLSYLASLGVTCIYLNPIFEAYSNHRYDTADYHNIDPLLGTREDFSELCERAREHGIRVMLDGVFSHTGADSVYFNRHGTYGAGGAYRDRNSPYFAWYKFTRYPDKYTSWWGIDTLPETNELNPHFRDFIADASNPESVVRQWLRLGASGWRLDVADELPDEFIADITNAARAEKPDAFVLGEVWEDASNKISYTRRRRYILGGMLDGVMGYTFRTALLAYILGGSAHDFRDSMLEIEENYPPAAFRSSLNILGTHDTPRIITTLNTHGDIRRARALVKIAALIQYAFPGTPCTYYGDEAGIEGAEDPYCRRTYPWGNEDTELLNHYRALGAARSSSAALKRGKLDYLGSVPDVLAFMRTLDGETVYVLANRSTEPRPNPVKAGSYTDLLSGSAVMLTHELPPLSAFLLV